MAVDLVRDGRAGALMKGKLHTDELLSAVLRRDTGLRTERRLSHVFALDVPDVDRILFITDAAINIAPDLETMKDIVQNAIDLVMALGIECPRTALLSAVETVTGKIPSTLLAASICKMHDRGQIVGGLIDGPLAYDNAISMEAVKAKGIVSDVAGRADILVAPNLESGNMIAKQLIHLGGAEGCGSCARGEGADHADEPRRRSFRAPHLGGPCPAPCRGAANEAGGRMKPVWLVLNIGSSTVKFGLFDVADARPLVRGLIGGSAFSRG